MSDAGDYTRWAATRGTPEDKFIRADEELRDIRSKALAEGKKRFEQGSLAAAGEFHMSRAQMAKHYADLHEQYRRTVALRERVDADVEAVDPATVGGQIYGVKEAADAAKKAAGRGLKNRIAETETQLVAVLNGMYKAYHGSAATDAEQAARIASAGSA